jgi:hypothetical protein
MKKENQSSADPRLSELLREARVAPGLPPGFQQNVWRRLEAAEAPARPASWLEVLANLVLRPRFAMVAAAVVLLAGILAGTWEGRQVARQDARTNYLASVAPATLR